MQNEISHDETRPEVISAIDAPSHQYYTPTESDKKLLEFVTSHTDKWREYRDQNFKSDWDKYERIFRGKWEENDKTRASERSKVISPATQQAIETRHAEVMEAIFGQGEFFDIKDDVNDANGTKLDVGKLKNLLKEDFAQDKVRKSMEAIVLLAEVFGTGIGEITVSTQKKYKPMQVPIGPAEMAYGSGEEERICIKLNPVNPKNFLFDPNGMSIDDCMGVAIEKYVSMHKIAKGVADGSYRDIEIKPRHTGEELEPTQESTSYRDDKVEMLTYYGLVPRKCIEGHYDEVDGEGSYEDDEYEDMVEAIVVIVNGSDVLKAEISPYMMHDRPVIAYQADTVPNRFLGRGTAEKAFNMQAAIDGSMRSHMDALALTVAPMIGVDATRIPRGAKFEVKPGKNLMTNGNPAEILFPFKFGTNDGQALLTGKEFERMLLMATGTVDSAGQVSQVSRDGQLDMATATLIKKYKRTLVNFQEDFLIPFIYKATWRYMQFDPKRYPAVDVTFIPTGTLGIIAREYEQKQLAFLVQTLGANSPLAPVLMQGIVDNSSLSGREEMSEAMKKMSQPDPKQQQAQEQMMMLDMQVKQAQAQKAGAEAAEAAANAEKAKIEAQLMPQVVKAKLIAALSNNLDEDAEGKDFERRAKIAELLIKEKDIDSNERIARMQVVASREKGAV